MHARLVFLATFAFAALAACGGGGGGGGTPVVRATPTPVATFTPTATPVPTPSPTPTPTPMPTNNDSRPSSTGDAFAYAGTMTVQFVRPPQAYGVVPSPNPANTQTLSYSVLQNQSVTGSQTYNGDAPAVAFATAETDTLLGGLSTTSSTSTEYYAFEASGASTLVHDLGGSVVTEGGDTFMTLVGSNNGVVDVLPEVAGPITVPADATLTSTEHDADGQTDTRKTNADGTYTENIVNIDGTTGAATANADGSGSYSLPIVNYLDNALIVVGTPVPTSASTPISTIPITVTLPAGLIPPTDPSVSPTPTVTTLTVKTWYPQPLAISNKTLVDAGQTSIPAACAIPSALRRSSSNELVETTSSIDPVFGEIDTRTTLEFTEPGVGVACMQLQDVLRQYYDLSEQTGNFLIVSSTPVQTTTTLETLGLTSENVIGLSSVARQAVVGASRARFAAMLDRKRAVRHAAIARVFRAKLTSHAGGRII